MNTNTTVTNAKLAAARSMKKFGRDTRGANMVEYIVLVGVVALLAMAGFKTFGGELKTKITTQGTTVQGIQ